MMNTIRSTSLFLFFMKYRILFITEWSVMLAYRSETLIWMLGAFIQPLVSLAVWLSISNQKSIGGYDARDYMLYFFSIVLIERLTRTWDVWELDDSIREGTLSAKLLRPFHPIHWSMASNLVHKLFFAMILIPSWFVLAWIFPILRLDLSWSEFGLTFVAISLASMVRFFIGFGFGLLAFWTNRAISLYMLYEGFHLLLAGRLAPLSMFPDWVADYAIWLPFYGTVGFPVELLVGKLSGDSTAIAWGFISQVSWTLIFYFIYRLEWKHGLKKYGAVGG